MMVAFCHSLTPAGN